MFQTNLVRQRLNYECRKCIDGQFGYHLWDHGFPLSLVKSNDVIFNENKMHKHLVKEVEVRKLVFMDVSTNVDASTCAYICENVVN